MSRHRSRASSPFNPLRTGVNECPLYLPHGKSSAAFKPITPVNLPEGTHVFIEADTIQADPEAIIREQLLADGANPEEVEKIIDKGELAFIALAIGRFQPAKATDWKLETCQTGSNFIR